MKTTKMIIIFIIFLFVNSTIAIAINIQNEEIRPQNTGGYIQSLINAASPGDTINIPSGTYNEDITINKQINLIGENKEDTIIVGTGKSNTVTITADNVKISGFTIKNSWDTEWHGGIGIYSNFNVIEDNILTENENGIMIGSTGEVYEGTTIEKNIFTENDRYGIRMVYYNGCTIYDNYISLNVKGGIDATLSININIIENIITNNGDDGIDLFDSHIMLVENNEVLHNDGTGLFSWGGSSRGTFRNNDLAFNNVDGIFIDQPYRKGMFIVEKNTINSNGRNGVHIQFSRENIVNNNEIINNKNGVHLLGASNNIIMQNNLTSNEYGVLIESDYECSSLNDFYYNNFRGNTVNARDECLNFWQNLVSYAGNYWDDYKGSDSNNDGIGDTPYEIDGGSGKDNFPLMKPWNENSRSRTVYSFKILQKILGFFLNFNKLIRR